MATASEFKDDYSFEDIDIYSDPVRMADRGALVVYRTQEKKPVAFYRWRQRTIPGQCKISFFASSEAKANRYFFLFFDRRPASIQGFDNSGITDSSVSQVFNVCQNPAVINGDCRQPYLGAKWQVSSVVELLQGPTLARLLDEAP